VAFVLGVAAAGCQQADLAERQQKAEANVCAQLDNVGKALQQVDALSPTSTIGEARSANEALGAALASLERSEAKLEQLQQKNFRKQLSSFKDEVNRVASNQGLTLEQAASELKQKAQPVIAARKQLATAVNCKE
jgi:hypothetical protein